jgi:O-antigen ligase
MIPSRFSELHLPFLASCFIIMVSVFPLLTEYPYLAVLPALGVLALLLFGRHPEFGLYAIIFLIPFGNFRSISGPLQNIKLHWLLALALLVIVAMRLLTDRSFVKRFQSNLWPWLFGFLTVSLLSTFLSEYKSDAVGQVALTLVAILFVGLTISLVDKAGVTRHIPIVIGFAVSLGSLLAVLGEFLNVGWFSLDEQSFSRSTGGTANPNALAMQIVFVVPFLVFWLTHARRRWIQLLAGFSIVINLAALVGTFSRSGALVVGASFLALFFINSRGIQTKQLGLVFAGAVLTLIIGAAMLPQSFWERQATLFSNSKERSLDRRGAYVIVARDAVLKRPLLGHGPGTFPELYAASKWAQVYLSKSDTLGRPSGKVGTRSEEAKRRYAHNTYLEVVVGTGIIGLVLYVGLLIRAIRNMLRARRRLLARGDRYHADEVTHYLVAFIFLLIFLAMFSDVFQKYMLLCLGLSQVWLRVATDEEPNLIDRVPTAPTIGYV